MTIDIKHLYFNTPLKRYEYLQQKLADMPKDVKRQYEFAEKATYDGWVYVEIRKGMYGLPQAGLSVQKVLEQRLAWNEYTQSKLTLGPWKHYTRPIQFCLVVDNLEYNT